MAQKNQNNVIRIDAVFSQKLYSDWESNIYW